MGLKKKKKKNWKKLKGSDRYCFGHTCMLTLRRVVDFEAIYSFAPSSSYGYVWIGCLRFGVWCFSFFWARICETYGYCSCTVQWTIVAKFDFSYSFQPISTYCALFTDLQISLFNNFFIKNESHGTIYTFKSYFATVFFSFQFSTVSKRTLKD